ncbi:MAG TPA: hypothetical protein VKU02_06585 [Gemmataceae bacterium]|nr:hypothetical protein [Gemmataceae bacterium]
MAFGLALRLHFYLSDLSMWHDEAALVLNVLHKDFLDLLGPLSFAEAAPPLFLWIERAFSLLFGESTYALRLIPFLASCGSLLIFLPVARSVLRPAMVPWALLLLACSDHALWHTCEAKPYAVDIFAGVVVLALYYGTASWTLGRRLLLLGFASPVLILLVYPGCFLCGGLLLAILPDVWRARQFRGWLSYGLLVLVIFTAFGLLVTGPIRAQRCEAILACWTNNFPDWERPRSVPAWTVMAFLELFRYCFEPIGQVLVPFALAGAVHFWRRGMWPLLALLLVPILLPLGAAYLHAYPFGGSRVVVYLTPALALLVAAGLPLSTGTSVSTGRLRAFCRAGVLVLPLVPLGWSIHRVLDPWKRADCAGAARYVASHHQPGDGIAANHWEYLYYFRRMGFGVCLLGQDTLSPQGRLWIVATATTAAERLEIVNHFAQQGWMVLEQREFNRTSVVLFSKCGRAPPSG